MNGGCFDRVVHFIQLKEISKNLSTEIQDSMSSITSENHLFLNTRPVAVDFGDDGPDGGRPGLVVPLCRWSRAGQEGDHVPGKLWVVQQEAESLSVHVLASRLLRPANTLVDNVRLRHPHVHGRPEAFRESLTAPRKLQPGQFGHTGS